MISLKMLVLILPESDHDSDHDSDPDEFEMTTDAGTYV